MTATHQAANDAEINEHTGELAGRLLDIQDKLYDMSSVLEFHHEAIMTLVESPECHVLESRSQRHGLALTGRRIIAETKSLSDALSAIRQGLSENGNGDDTDDTKELENVLRAST